jgi:hypothetical protein
MKLTGKVKKICSNCGKEIEMFPSRAKKAEIFFCNKSCHRAYKNKDDNPSKHRDLSGKNNPMFGKHPVAWNKGMKGELCHNWKGGLHKRFDGYYRINVNGERFLLHRFITKADKGQVVHHIDGNPENNSVENLIVCESQSEHIKKYH